MWFKQRPRNNYGVAADRLMIADIDVRNGGVENWKQLIAGKGMVPTWRVRTGSGGWHVFYAMPFSGIGSAKSIPGIDLKAGKGSYVVGAGCSHASGGHYAWDTLHNPHTAPLQLPPDWLIEALTEGQRKGPKPVEFFREIAASRLCDGERHKKILSLIGHLISRDVDPHVVREIADAFNIARCVPQLDPDDVETMVRNILTSETEKLLGHVYG
jgi:hypothetical protein